MKKNLYGLFSVLFSVVFFVSCSSSKQDVSSLLSGRWNIAEVNGEKINAEKKPFIEFDAATKRLHGNAGCNNFNAGYKLGESKATSLQILPGGATLMACPDMETEGKVLKSLDKVASVKKAGTGLQLLDQSGAVVFLLDKAQ